MDDTLHTVIRFFEQGSQLDKVRLAFWRAGAPRRVTRPLEMFAGMVEVNDLD
jgi:hypothetical protein